MGYYGLFPSPGSNLACVKRIMTFLFENLEVYKQAVGFCSKVFEICKTIGDPEVKNQIKRASLSIPLNIAEGNGRNTAKEKAQFFKTARGSLFECVPIIKICRNTQMITKENYESLYSAAEGIGKMLNGLINSLKDHI